MAITIDKPGQDLKWTLKEVREAQNVSREGKYIKAMRRTREGKVLITTNKNPGELRQMQKKMQKRAQDVKSKKLKIGLIQKKFSSEVSMQLRAKKRLNQVLPRRSESSRNEL